MPTGGDIHHSAAGAKSKQTYLMSFPWDKADLAVTSTQKYTQPSKSKVTVASLVFPASDRLNEPTLSETQSRYIRHSATTIASANDEGTGAGGAKPHDIPDYINAAEYMKRGFVKLGYENVGHGDTESRAAFPSMASTLYLNPRAAKVVPLAGTGLCLGNDAPSFATDSRDAFTRPPAGARGLTHQERLAINLAVNVAKFQLGVETAPGGGFETTSRHAAAEMMAASRKAGGASSGTGHHTMHGSLIKKGEEDAAHLAKVTHINFSADAQEKNDFSTTSRAGQPRYPTSAYAERTGPVDPSAAAGAIGHATTVRVFSSPPGVYGGATAAPCCCVCVTPPTYSCTYAYTPSHTLSTSNRLSWLRQKRVR